MQWQRLMPLQLLVAVIRQTQLIRQGSQKTCLSYLQGVGQYFRCLRGTPSQALWPLLIRSQKLRKPAIVANWKMNKTIAEALQFVADSRMLFKDIPVNNVDIILSPSFAAINPVADAVSGDNIFVAAQNLHWEAKGAFTGEISAGVLIDCGWNYDMNAHSERRNLFGEPDEGINKKIRRAIHAGPQPLFCDGGSLQRR